MPRRSRTHCLIVTLVAALWLPGVAIADAEAETAGTISGQVLFYASQRGVTGATVVAHSAALDGGQTTVVTNPDGTFELTSLPEGTYDVIAYYGELVARRTRIAVQQWVPRRINLYIREPVVVASLGDAVRAVPAPEVESSTRASASPRGLEVASQLRYLHLRGADAEGLSDFLVVGSSVSASIGHVTLSAGADLLARTDSVPTPANGRQSADRRFQAVRGGVDIGIGEAGAAFVDVAGGPQRFERGGWSTATVGGLWRLFVGRHLAFEPRISLQTTSLFNRTGSDQWLAEGLGGATARYRAGIFGAWATVDLGLPLTVSADTDDATNPHLDPRVRANLELGLTIRASDHINIFTAVSLVERGDASVSGTTLPILDGGADQTQVVLGVSGRFGASGE